MSESEGAQRRPPRHDATPKAPCCGPTTWSPATCPASTSSTVASLYCHEGELVGIIGPNGAGKSTLIKAIFGLVTVAEGTVKLKGEEITDQRADELVAPASATYPRPTTSSRPDGRARTSRWACTWPRRPSASGSTAWPDLPPARRAQGPAGRLAVRRRAADGRHGPCPDDGAVGPAARRALRRPVPRDAGRGLRPAKHINEAGVSMVMVEQNARRCLQICDRGYVLDQGRTPTPTPASGS